MCVSLLLTKTHLVLEEKDATEKAEEIGGEQRQVNGGGAGRLHHAGHEAVQRHHAEDVDGKQKDYKHTTFELSRDRLSILLRIPSSEM